MEEKILTDRESIALITGMINKAKNHYHESGSSTLLWGFTNVICFALAYFQETYPAFPMPFNPFWLMLIAGIFQVYFFFKERGTKKMRSYKDEAHYYIWTAFGVSVLILTVAGGFSGIGYIVLPLLLLLFGIPTFVSGSIKNFKPLIIGGMICWGLSADSFFYRGNEVFLFAALGAFCAWVIPGFILRNNYLHKQGNHQYGI